MVGGGVIGLTTAVVLAERGRRVRVWTREPAEATTSAVAGALWWPYRIEPEVFAGEWALASLSVYEELATRPGETGVRMVEGVQAGLRLDDAGAVGGSGAASCRETDEGLRARLPLIDMPVHLGWLRERFLAAGGVVEKRSVEDLAEAAGPDGADVVVNCTGLGARDLVPDPAVRPVRGQLVVVENPGITTWFTSAGHGDATTTYFFPQPGGLILGGTAEEDEWSLVTRSGGGRRRSCGAVRGAAGDRRGAGARPPDRAAAHPGRRYGWSVNCCPAGRLLVHNYGHGGAGMTVAWGCAQDAAGLCEG